MLDLRLPRRFNAAEYFIDRHIEEGRGAKTAILSEKYAYTYRELYANVNRTANVLAGYRMAVMQEERRKLLGEQAMLRVEKNTLERLERVERLASAEGMVFPKTGQRIFVEVSELEAGQ